MAKDTIITVTHTSTARHDIRIYGEPDEQTMARYTEAVELADMVTDAVDLLCDEGAKVIEYEHIGRVLESGIEFDMTRKVDPLPANQQVSLGTITTTTILPYPASTMAAPGTVF